MKQPVFLKRRTKIVCTIGPASGSASVIERLIRSGMNIARLNLSHGNHNTHSKYIKRVRSLSQRLKTEVAVIIDLPGPKYRTGKLRDGQVVLKRGAVVTLTGENIEGDATLIPVNLPNLFKDAKPGDTVLLDDGALSLKVQKITGEKIECTVKAGGVLTEGRGLVVPGMHTTGPFITGEMRDNILFAIKEGPDYLAVSFVSSAEDILKIKGVLRENNSYIPLISKIERGQAVKYFDDILEVSDGIMVARGDLGVDIPMEQVPLVQKDIIHKCNRIGKPVITATQMLESMVNSASPTRAEVTDVANAILDGTDATMLSAETSIGRHPIAALRTMAKIAFETEKRLPYESMLTERGAWIEKETDELISYNACHTAHSLGATAIVAFTQSGSTARRVSKYRPRVPILAITPDKVVLGRLILYWGVYPFMKAEAYSSLEDMFCAGAGLARELGLARTGSQVIITGGVPMGVTGTTNLLKVESIS